MNGKEYSFSLSDIWSQYVAQAGLEYLILQSQPLYCRHEGDTLISVNCFEMHQNMTD